MAAFEGNKAETATIVPVINAFKTAHQLTDVTVVADAGMIAEANLVALQAAGLSFILGARIPYLPDVVREWRDKHPDEVVPDGLVLTQPWPSTSAEKARRIPDRVIHYQFRHDRARRTRRGIDEQVRKAERAVDGHAPVKRNRYIQLSGATKSVNRTLEAKTRALAGWKGYVDVGVMPTGDVSCLVGSCRGWIHRHNQRLCSQVSKGSAGWYAPARVSGWRVRSRALRLMAMSAWR